MTNVTFAGETKLITKQPISHFLSQKNRPNKGTKFFRWLSFSPGISKKESMTSFNYISARLNDGSSKPLYKYR